MNSSFPVVAILLTVYNGKEFIAEQLDSIFIQQGVSCHIFISVDLSTDGSYEWCKDVEKTHGSVTVLEYGRRFGGAASNFFRLLREVGFSSFDYVAFADQDDIWLPDKLSHGIRQMDCNGAEAYSANVIAFWEDGREKLIDKAQPQKELDYLFEAAGPGCTYIFTRKAAGLIKHYLNKYSQLNECILHDWLSYAILRHNKYKWFIDLVPKLRYRQHDTNQVGANTTLKGKIERLRYVLSGEVFGSIRLFVDVFGESHVDLSTRLGVVRLAFKARQLRRCGIDQVYAFIALLLYALKWQKR